MTAAPMAGSGCVTKNARRGELEESVGTSLRLLAQDAELVAPSARDWWTRYLETHQSHVLTLLRLTVPWVSPYERRSVVDVGSFPGLYSVVLAQLGYTVSAVDLAPERAGTLWEKHGIEAWKRDIEIEDLPIASSSVAFATLSEVLEHLRVNPFKPLREIHRVLQPGGHVLISVPHISPRHRIRFFLGKDYQGDIISEYQSLEGIGHMGPYRLLSRAEIRAMLAHTGFEVKSEIVTGWLPRGRWSFVRFLGPLRNQFRSHYYVVAEKRFKEPGHPA
jgi:2-polyprenyl-3-methyl-5-hydroxy-6-metoxy-1,4-benzoquinol methylase